jgi:hypothetical protein
MSEMRERSGVCSNRRKALAVHRVSASSIPDIRNDSSQYKNTADFLVLGSIPYDDR